MAPRPVAVAVIGNGRWGKNIIKTLEGMPGIAVTSITRKYLELLKKNNLDAVVVATPPSTHVGVAMPFIERGLPVFIEKPLAMSNFEAERLLAASKKHKAPVFVGHVHLYNPAYIAAKKAIKKAGKLRMMSGEGASNGPFRVDYSAMWDWAPHDLSMMLDISGEKPTSVQAWGEALTRPTSKLHDFTLMRVNFPSGVFGIIYSSKLSPQKRRTFTAVGSHHSVLFDDTAEKKVTLFKGAGPSITKEGVKEKQPVISYPDYEPISPLTRELEAFVEMVHTRKKPLSDLESGVEVVKVLEAAEKSILEGGVLIKIKK